MSKIQILADKTAISLSFICTLHCLALPIAVIMLPSLASLPLADEAFHLWLLYAVIPISVIALFMGCKKHQRYHLAYMGITGLALMISAVMFEEDFGELFEKSLTLAGAVLIAVGHFWNYRLCQTQEVCDCTDPS